MSESWISYFPNLIGLFRHSPNLLSLTKGHRHILSACEKLTISRMIPFVMIMLRPCRMTDSFMVILTLPRSETGPPSVVTSNILQIDVRARSCIFNTQWSHA